MGTATQHMPDQPRLRTHQHPLSAFFQPQTVALIGATDSLGSVGHAIMRNLAHAAFGGHVYPINPKRTTVAGLPAYPNLAAVPEPIDLAVIATPAATVPAVIADCAAHHVRAAVIISAGFKECGAAGAALEQQVLAAAHAHNLRIIGPNCLGLMNPRFGLNATFANRIALPGNVGFISQSGALCTAVLDWSLQEQVGFSAFVSVGSMLDVGWGDLIDYLGDDPHTECIVIYMESIGDARAFLSAAREVALTKPIIVLKTGRTSAAAKAAASHTGTLAGADAVLDAAFRRCGVLRVDSIAELFNMAEVLAKQPRPNGPRLLILTNAGGPGVLATDALISGGGALATLSPNTVAQLDRFLPTAWSHGNPVDMLGDADAERYGRAAAVVREEPNSDGVLVVLTPQAMTDPLTTATGVVAMMHGSRKPLLASWMGGHAVAPAQEIFHQAGIPTFSYPDEAARVFTHMWRYNHNLQTLYETPTLPPAAANIDRQRVAQLIAAADARGHTLLNEAESKQLLAAYGLPVNETFVATSADHAVKLAKQIGFPVVLKLASATLTHKSDVGGVQVDLRTATAVRRAYHTIRTAVTQRAGAEHFGGVTVQAMVARTGYELILGSSCDPQFGPVVLFGAGGTLVEVMQDRALGLPPLNTTLARRMIEHTKIARAFHGARGGGPTDMHALEHVLVRLSQLVAEQPRISEIDINPLLASGDRLLALDARVVLHPAACQPAELPRLAIRPYPAQYTSTWHMADGEAMTVRPIRPEDEPKLVAFHHTLSERSVYQRYFHVLKLDTRIDHERLTRQCFVDYDRAIALVVERHNPASGVDEIVAVGRLTRLHGRNAAEFALVVSDNYQGHGIGSMLLERVLAVARAEQIAQVIGYILPDNTAMRKLAQKLGFRTDYRDDAVEAVIDL